jgi:hypothetical protein
MTTVAGTTLRAGCLGLAAAGLAVAVRQARGATAGAVRTAVEALLLAAPLGLATHPGAAGSRAAVVWALAAPVLHAASEASGGSDRTTGLITAACAGMIVIWNAVQGACKRGLGEIRVS